MSQQIQTESLSVAESPGAPDTRGDENSAVTAGWCLIAAAIMFWFCWYQPAPVLADRAGALQRGHRMDRLGNAAAYRLS
jgi:hypothetical protein